MDDLQQLEDLLRRRVELIGDARLREGDPDAHLAALREVSEAIMAAHERLRPTLPPRLEHFLARCSYDKALDWLVSRREQT